MKRIFLATLLALCIAAAPTFAQTQRINPESDLVYLGAFKLPNEHSGTPQQSWSYGGAGATFNPSNNSLFSVGFPNNYASEFSIPTPSLSRVISQLPASVTLQHFGDVTGGYGTSGALTQNQLIDVEAQSNGTLSLSVYQYYQPAQTMKVFGCSSQAIGSPPTQGWWRIGAYPAAATSRYFFQIDPTWAAANTPGKTLAAGRSRVTMGGSWGPTLFATDPACPTADGVAAPTTRLLFYDQYPQFAVPSQHAIAGYSNADDLTDGAWLTVGDKSAVVFAETKSERTASGGFQYYGIAEPHGCGAKGYHGEPYSGTLAFYDPNDLAAVAAGTKQPWEPQPYARFRFEAQRFLTGCQRSILGGVAYDRANQLLYVMETRVAVYNSYDRSPIVHVFHLADAGLAPDTTAPTVPANLRTTTVTATSIGIAWDAATDDHAGIDYIVFRDPVDLLPDPDTHQVHTFGPGPHPIASQVGTTYADTKELTSGAALSYYVAARDAVGHVSAVAGPLAVTVP